MSNPGQSIEIYYGGTLSVNSWEKMLPLSKASISLSKSTSTKTSIRSDSHYLAKGHVVDVMYFDLSKVFHKVQATFIKALCSLHER